MDQYKSLTANELIALLIERDVTILELKGRYNGLKTHFNALQVHHRETIDLHTNLLKKITSIASE